MYIIRMHKYIICMYVPTYVQLHTYVHIQKFNPLELRKVQGKQSHRNGIQLTIIFSKEMAQYDSYAAAIIPWD